MLRVWARIQHYGGSKYKYLGIKTFINPRKVNDSYPKLKGRGTQVKSLVLLLLRTWSEYMDTGDPYHCSVQRCLEALLHISDLIDATATQTFMPRTDCIKLREIVGTFLNEYTSLGIQSDHHKDLLFSGVPKLHWLWHLAHRAFWLHPRRVACWLDEDFMQHCRIGVHFSTRGRQRHNVPEGFFKRYRYAQDLEGKSAY